MTDVSAAAVPAPAAPRSTPAGLLDTIKDDLNIPPTDTTNDAWLQRRIDGVWARIEAYCHRTLCSPPQPFVDDWGEVTINGVHYNVPPPIRYWPKGSPFLNVFPVRSITALRLNGSDVAPLQVAWDVASGKLFTLDGPPAYYTPDVYGDLTRRLLYEQARIGYTAGWDTLPADLYEALLGALQPIWASRQSQVSGAGLGGINRIDVMDVGSVELKQSSPFVESAMQSAPPGGADPMLGPWLTYLDPYVDHRAVMGAPSIQTTTAGAP
jgi:hypothetical protein